jgi:hypothetical protein
MYIRAQEGLAAAGATGLQGQVIRISGPAGADAARLDGRTVRLFPQAGGGVLGLMPVPASQTPGA